MRFALGLAACLTALASAGMAEEAGLDPYIWLEQVQAPEALAWVRQQNAISLKLLKSDPEYQKNYDTILGLLDADDRIPMGELHGDTVFNFWQDAAHPRGFWRRTTIASYETANPEWETLLDLDKLSADEGKNWVYSSAACTPEQP